ENNRITKGKTYWISPNDPNDSALAGMNDVTVTVTDSPSGETRVYFVIFDIPIANAGSDQTLHVGDLVTLDASASYDPDEQYPLAFLWSIISMPEESNVTLSDPTAVNPSFTPDLLGNYTINLMVTDNLGVSSVADEVVISTFNTAPIADASLGQAIIEIGTTVQLDGAQSFDDDGDTITYNWIITSMPVGSLATLDDPTSAGPAFVADIHGDYAINLVVMDSFGATSNTDTIRVSFDNVKPVANAGINQSAILGDTVFFDGSESQDANFDPLTYSWNIVSLPEGSQAILNTPIDVQTSFDADVAGTYVVSLVVNDGFVDSIPHNISAVVITVETAVTQEMDETVETINSLDPVELDNNNQQNALTNKINSALESVDQGNYQEALNKLQRDILGKTNGCAETGLPDKNDWIDNCDVQEQVYPLIINTIELLESLI
ncbi:MAG: PKD domain-containing protein, partial [Thermodesulfovibrionales bacterium]|nr:PKD domain-containing protein [Thermodesulfovibrionales bacterium]